MLPEELPEPVVPELFPELLPEEPELFPEELELVPELLELCPEEPDPEPDGFGASDEVPEEESSMESKPDPEPEKSVAPPEIVSVREGSSGPSSTAAAFVPVLPEPSAAEFPLVLPGRKDPAIGESKMFPASLPVFRAVSERPLTDWD